MKNFYRKKRILITGHTGFKGTWLSKVLIKLGAEVTGFSLKPPTNPNLFDISGVEREICSVIGDVRDYKKLRSVFNSVNPEIVIHLAAQPIVSDSYANPMYTYETNIMGTINISECIRGSDVVKSILNVTTDKVYLNNEGTRGYKENDPLDGYDPYSNSKSCSEIITHGYNNSFFKNEGIAASTARSGNAIGGGDFAKDRIISDCVRAIKDKSKIKVRNPQAVRPYQYVLESVIAYLFIVKKQYEDIGYAGYYNVGPDEDDCVTTKNLVNLFYDKWHALTGESCDWIDECSASYHESKLLRLDCSKIKKTLGWTQTWNLETAVEKTVEWTKIYLERGNIPQIMDQQIQEFLNTQKNV